MKFTPEQLLQIDCLEFTRIMCPGVLVIASMNGMFLGNMRNPAAYISKMKKLGMRVGDLDLRLHWNQSNIKYEDRDYHFYAGACTAYIELKAGRNTPTEDQKNMMDQLNKIGISCSWTNSLEGYVTILKSLGVPMRNGIYGRIIIDDQAR